MTVVALAPGWDTPVTVSEALVLLTSERLTDLASLGAYGVPQPGTGPGVAPAS